MLGRVCESGQWAAVFEMIFLLLKYVSFLSYVLVTKNITQIFLYFQNMQGYDFTLMANVDKRCKFFILRCAGSVFRYRLFCSGKGGLARSLSGVKSARSRCSIASSLSGSRRFLRGAGVAASAFGIVELRKPLVSTNCSPCCRWIIAKSASVCLKAGVFGSALCMLFARAGRISPSLFYGR